MKWRMFLKVLTLTFTLASLGFRWFARGAALPRRKARALRSPSNRDGRQRARSSGLDRADIYTDPFYDRELAERHRAEERRRIAARARQP